MSFLLKEKMIDFYWKTKRSYWRNKSKLKQVKFFFKRIFSRVENYFIATYWKIYKKYRYLHSILNWLYWKFHKIGGILYSKLNSSYWKMNSFYWKLRKIGGILYSKLNSFYWKLHSSRGTLMVALTNIYWKIRRFFASLRIGLVKFSLNTFFQTRGFLYKSGTSLYWSFVSLYSSVVSMTKKIYWSFRNSFLWAPFNKIYWFLKFQYQKRILKKNN